VLVAAGLIAHAAGHPTQTHPETDIIGSLIAERFADLTEVYSTRAEFGSAITVHELFNGARDVKAAGLSLNMICQQYGDTAVRQLVERGARVRCLFLDPAGVAMKTREVEEGFPPGHLAALTELNIQTLDRRVRARLTDDHRQQLELGTYNETVRFNITIIDHAVCIVQPYLPDSRGVDSPTFVIRRRSAGTGLFAIFDQVFDSLWERRRAL
jgi:hypothetical protein